MTLELDLYLPRGDTVTRRPALIWVHGGGFTAGDKSSGATQATFFARRGYVAASINYRLLSENGCGGDPTPPPECEQAALAAQHDAQAAVRWLRANAATYAVDTDRIAMAGSSAGAVTSLLVDWRSEDPGGSGNPGFSSAIRAAVSVSGGAPTNEYIDEDDPPAIFFHGSEDDTVPFEWAVRNAAAMYGADIFTVLEVIQGAGHGLGWTTLISSSPTTSSTTRWTSPTPSAEAAQAPPGRRTGACGSRRRSGGGGSSSCLTPGANSTQRGLSRWRRITRRAPG